MAARLREKQDKHFCPGHEKNEQHKKAVDILERGHQDVAVDRALDR